MAATLVKTDKNGTRYYESDDCPKCGGSGVIREYGHIEDAICHKGPEEIKAMVMGQKVVLRGTVKDQKVHEGLKETVLNRCKFTRAA
jgi:hypothetical protein